jgi:hypothetical protein
VPGNSPENISRSVGTGYRLPGRESPLSGESLVNRSQMMTSYAEEIVNAAVETKKALDLDHRFEATHVTFSFPRHRRSLGAAVSIAETVSPSPANPVKAEPS